MTDLPHSRMYEHVDPALVGNVRNFPISSQSGRAAMVHVLAKEGIHVDADSPRLGEFLELVKAKETAGYSYDEAHASFVLLALRFFGTP